MGIRLDELVSAGYRVLAPRKLDGPSGRHRAGRRGRPMTSAVLVQTMVDARTLIEHLVDLDTLAAARHHGRYTALCDADVLAASMTSKERGFCRECLRRQVGRCA